MTTTSSSAKKLTDAQLVILSSASQRADGLLAIADGAHPSVGKTVTALLKRALLAETPVRRAQPCWRRDEKGKPIGAKITPEGLALLGVDDTAAGSDIAAPADTSTVNPSLAASAKPGTKQALIVDLLQRPVGATISDLMGATGWLPHTTRAALSGLRQKGFVLDKTRTSDGAPSYRIAVAAAEAA